MTLLEKVDEESTWRKHEYLRRHGNFYSIFEAHEYLRRHFPELGLAPFDGIYYTGPGVHALLRLVVHSSFCEAALFAGQHLLQRPFGGTLPPTGGSQERGGQRRGRGRWIGRGAGKRWWGWWGNTGCGRWSGWNSGLCHHFTDGEF